MSGKYIIGGAAAAGVAYYMYEKQQASQPQTWSGIKYNEMKGDTVGAKVDKHINNLQKTADVKTDQAKSWASDKSADLQKQAQQTSEDAQSWGAKKQKQGENYWKEKGKPLLKESVEDGKNYFDKIMEDANRRIDGSSRKTYPVNNDPNKSIFLRAGDTYIDSVNQVAYALHDGVYSLFGVKSDAQKKAEQTKKDASSWFGDKKDKAKSGWLKFDTDEAISTASKGFGENSSFWALEEKEQNSIGAKLKNSKDGVVDSLNKAGESALATVGSAKEVMDKKSKEAASQVNDATELAKPWFGLKSVDQRDEEKLDKLIAEMSRGYGENATFFARESYEDIVNQPVLIEELREKAKKNLDDARLNLDKQSNHWYNWFSKKDKEAQKQAKEQWQNALLFSDDVEKRLVEGNKVFKDWTDSAISGTKQGLNYANDKTQQGLSGAQNWIRGDK